MPLVEIIKGEKTSDEALARVFDYTLAIGKTPIVVNDSRGFFTSRVIGTFVNEALAMLGEGVAPASIEHAGGMAGYPAAPLQLSDELNLELMHKIAVASRKGVEDAGGTYEPHPAEAIVEKMIEIGRPSRLKGAGFYEYIDGKRTQLWPGLKDTFNSGSSEIPIQDMVDRMLFAEALETQKCIDEGVLMTTADANIGSILGIGFPPWTGGSAQYIVGYEGPAGIGKEAFVARAKELAAKYGDASCRRHRCVFRTTRWTENATFLRAFRVGPCCSDHVGLPEVRMVSAVSRVIECEPAACGLRRKRTMSFQRIPRSVKDETRRLRTVPATRRR